MLLRFFYCDVMIPNDFRSFLLLALFVIVIFLFYSFRGRGWGGAGETRPRWGRSGCKISISNGFGLLRAGLGTVKWGRGWVC